MTDVFSPHRRGKAPPLWLIVLVLAATVLGTTAAAAWGSLGGTEHSARRVRAASQPASPSPSPAPPVSATVVVDRDGTGSALPRTVLGLSYEADQLALVPGLDPASGNLPNLMRNLGTGHLKIGANAVDDYVYWNPSGETPVPAWAKTPIGRPHIDRLARLSAATGWPVELGVNLAHLDAARIADQARYAVAQLGDRLLAMECGNEPNGYPGRVRPADYGYAQYQADFDACSKAIESAGARLAGPNTYNNAWISNFARDHHRRLVLLTNQPYALSQHNRTGLTLTDLLSPDTARANLAALAEPLAAARKYGLPLRHDETNSVNLGGLKGVSDVYATALWAIDYTLMLAANGLSGVNFHGTLGVCDRPEQDMKARIYTPLCATSEDDLRTGMLSPRPLYYGMLMVSLMGSGRFVPATVTTTHNLTAYAVRGDDGRTRIMVVNKEPAGAEPVTTALATGQAPGSRASVLRLTGASLDSAKDITIGGATVRRDGTFTPGRQETVTATETGLTVTIRGASAALITLD